MNEEVKGKKCPQLRFSGFDDDWEEKKLGNVSDRVTRKNENLESTLPLTISAQYGLVDQITFFNNQVASTTNLRNYFLVKNGEFAYNKSYSAGYPWGAIKRLDRYEKGVLSTLYIVFKPKNINSDYLLSYYDTNKWYKQVSEIAAEGARNHGLLNIAPIDFFQTTFVAPKSELEQQKIGAFLSHVDSLIQAKTKKLESLKAVKKSLLQKCFPKAGEKVPEMRFAGFSGDWEEKRLGEIITEIKRTDEKSNAPVMMITAENGFINQSDRYSFNNAGQSLKKYIVLEKFEMAYNHGASKLRPFGSSFALITEESARIPYVYHCFSTIENPEFLSLVLNGKNTEDQLRKIVTSGARMDGLLNISFLEFSSIYVLIPPTIKEQEKIANFFSKYDSLISAQQKEIDKLKDIKKSLLQKMFI